MINTEYFASLAMRPASLTSKVTRARNYLEMSNICDVNDVRTFHQFLISINAHS